MTSAELLVQLVKSPLYKKWIFATDQLNNVARDLQVHERRFDLFCPRCDKESTWKLVVSEDTARRYKLDKSTVAPIGPGNFRGGPAITNWAGRFHLTTLCSRNLSHSAIYYFETGSQPKAPKAIAVPAESNQKADHEGLDEEESESFILKIGQSPSLFEFQKDVLGDLSKD